MGQYLRGYLRQAAALDVAIGGPALRCSPPPGGCRDLAYRTTASFARLLINMPVGGVSTVVAQRLAMSVPRY